MKEEGAVPAVVSIIDKCLGIYGEKMFAYRNIVTFLHIGG